MMSAILLPIEVLSREAFRPFGDVIDLEGAHHYPINNGSCTRYHDLAKIDIAGVGGRPLLNVFRAQPVGDRVEIAIMEKHPLGSQAFIPLGNRPFLIVVSEKEQQPLAATLRCFLARNGQGVNYARDVWHHPLLALDIESDFLVVDRGGDEDNCDLFNLPSADRPGIDMRMLENL